MKEGNRKNEKKTEKEEERFRWKTDGGRIKKEDGTRNKKRRKMK